MDKTLLKKSALYLVEVLEKYKPKSSDAQKLSSSLQQLLKLCLEEKLDSPMSISAVPGAYFFNEGNLREFSDLESAYSGFVVEVTGGETPVLKRLREEIDNLRNK